MFVTLKKTRCCLYFFKCRLSSVPKDSSLNANAVNPSVLTFNEIPGPKSYPVIGTLYKYWPLLGKFELFCVFTTQFSTLNHSNKKLTYDRNGSTDFYELLCVFRKV